MNNYIDGFAFPIKKEHLNTYKEVAIKVAEIWKELGALSYQEFYGDDMNLPGVLSFNKVMNAEIGEVIVFGWVVYASKEIRDEALTKSSKDQRILDLVGPLMSEPDKKFDPTRMAYGGFKPLIKL